LFFFLVENSNYEKIETSEEYNIDDDLVPQTSLVDLFNQDINPRNLIHHIQKFSID